MLWLLLIALLIAVVYVFSALNLRAGYGRLF
jgi:hypothetical protein